MLKKLKLRAKIEIFCIIVLYTEIITLNTVSLEIKQARYNLRCLEDGKVKVPEKMKKSCTGFSYIGPKLWNNLPAHIRKTTIKSIFKHKVKDWIWEFIPSV